MFTTFVYWTRDRRVLWAHDCRKHARRLHVTRSTAKRLARILSDLAARRKATIVLNHDGWTAVVPREKGASC